MIKKESEDAAKKKKEVLGQRVEALPSLSGMSKLNPFILADSTNVKSRKSPLRSLI